MSLDNLHENGATFKACFECFVQVRKDVQLLQWIAKYVQCPDTIVDRITPKPDQALRNREKRATFKDDKVPVSCESYCELIIGNSNFTFDRPKWENVGIRMVNDVKPYEEVKIRMLNAMHCHAAFHGALRSLTYIDE